jgi:hypothetical protein
MFAREVNRRKVIDGGVPGDLHNAGRIQNGRRIKGVSGLKFLLKTGPRQAKSV